MTTVAGSGYVERIRGSWYLRCSLRDPSGRAKQKRINLGPSRAIRSRAQARSIADQWLARQSPSTLQPGPRVRFGEFCELYLVEHVAGLRASSRRRYRCALRSLQVELAGELVCNVDASRLKRALISLSKSKAFATVRFARTLALAMLRRARNAGYAAHVVHAREVDLPRNSAPERERTSFNRAQLDQVLDASDGKWRALWAVMAFAGLRVGEALALEWRDVDFHARLIRVRRNLSRDGVGATKTVASAASVPLLPELEQILRVFRGDDIGEGLVFVNARGRALDPDNVRRRRLQPLLTRLGLPKAGMHAFRHSTPALLLTLELGTELVRRFMRHSSLAVTARYTHSNDKDLRAAIDAASERRSRFHTGMAAS